MKVVAELKLLNIKKEHIQVCFRMWGLTCLQEPLSMEPAFKLNIHFTS